MRPVRTAADLKQFIAFPYRLFRGSPYWVPPLRMDVRKMLSPDKNPFFDHAEVQLFLATGPGGAVAGRIAAIHNQAHNDFHDDTVGFFGFFECIDDRATAAALLDHACDWLRARRLTVARGPASFSTNDECGLVVRGFDVPPTVLTPWTPPHYLDLVEAAGFVPAKDLLQYQSTSTSLPDRLVRASKRIAARQGIRLRRLEMKRFFDEVEIIKGLYNSAWERNWGFVPMTDDEIDHMAKNLKRIAVPDLVVFAEKDDRVIGFAAAIPDLNVALKTNPSGGIFPGLLKVLWAARKVARIRIMLLGLLPEYRRSGADALMYHWIWEKGCALGYRWAEAGWILEDNAPMNNALVRMGFEHYRTLRLYEKPL